MGQGEDLGFYLGSIGEQCDHVYIDTICKPAFPPLPAPAWQQGLSQSGDGRKVYSMVGAEREGMHCCRPEVPPQTPIAPLPSSGLLGREEKLQ